jgi:large subunit ribosomal protein L5
MKNVLEQKYIDDVKPALMKELGIENALATPRVEKIVVNIGLGEALAIANFKLREGREIGAKVTLRGYKMWSFLDRLVNIALPRVRDFRGIPAKSFDGRGNYTLGLNEQLIFPEIVYDQIDKVRGMEITVVTSAHNDEQAYLLLELLGMPFTKDEE